MKLPRQASSRNPSTLQTPRATSNLAAITTLSQKRLLASLYAFAMLFLLSIKAASAQTTSETFSQAVRLGPDSAGKWYKVGHIEITQRYGWTNLSGTVSTTHGSRQEFYTTELSLRAKQQADFGSDPNTKLIAASYPIHSELRVFISQNTPTTRLDLYKYSPNNFSHLLIDLTAHMQGAVFVPESDAIEGIATGDTEVTSDGNLLLKSSLQVGDGTRSLGLGSARGQSLAFGTGYLGFNAVRNPVTNRWSLETDSANNGGAVVYSSIWGDLRFVTIGSNDPEDRQIISDGGVRSRVRMVVKADGRVGIGTDNPGSNLLAVEGKLAAREVHVTIAQPFPDYVFDDDYPLEPLSEVKDYIQKHRRLPGIPSAEEVAAGGMDLGDMQLRLLAKIEELTLYVIDLERRQESLEQENAEMRKLSAKAPELEPRTAQSTEVER